jgi:hypothetical protein
MISSFALPREVYLRAGLAPPDQLGCSGHPPGAPRLAPWRRAPPPARPHHPRHRLRRRPGPAPPGGAGAPRRRGLLRHPLRGHGVGAPPPDGWDATDVIVRLLSAGSSCRSSTWCCSTVLLRRLQPVDLEALAGRLGAPAWRCAARRPAAVGGRCGAAAARQRCASRAGRAGPCPPALRLPGGSGPGPGGQALWPGHRPRHVPGRCGSPTWSAPRCGSASGRRA